MSLEWPEAIPENGRLSEGYFAWATGICRVMDGRMSCTQILNITLFFDGTNNNDSPDNPWRDSKTKTHTNVARLRNVALEDKENGNFHFYIPGVGTPFPEIGEQTYSQRGKALADGFNQRCVWGYTRLLNAVYYAISRSNFRELIPASDARQLCNDAARGVTTAFDEAVHGLGVAHKQAYDEGRYHRTVRHVWINVIGFSRGAAAARAFVHRLTNKWAPGGNLINLTGRYAVPYQVNFMGLFDTVASVGLPDSTRAAVDLNMFDGHAGFARDGGLNIPDSVRFVRHAISIHEQRMSFPLDSIAHGRQYGGDSCWREVAYPGVHSDIGGGYAPGDQGKGEPGDDGHKLSQIALHDMYIAALRAGVPLHAEKTAKANSQVAQVFKDDFALNPATAAAFNAWLATTEPIDSVADALKFGMGQMLAWRTRRARIGTADYVTEQPFFQRAREDTFTPHKVEKGLGKARKTDPQYLKLNEQLQQTTQQKYQAVGSRAFPANMAEVKALDAQIDSIQVAIRTRVEALCGEVAYPDAKSPRSARPGEGPCDIGTNDQTDLREGAEEMRLLLGHLYPQQQREPWRVTQSVRLDPSRNAYPATPHVTLSVRRAQPNSDSPEMALATSGFIFKVAWSTVMSRYDVGDDVLAAPVSGMIPLLRQYTSEETVNRLSPAVIELYDNYVHDSRCWFRVPYFREYAPGGYGWARVYFAGGDTRVRYLGMATDAQLDRGSTVAETVP